MSIGIDIQKLRKNYSAELLVKKNVEKDPFLQFKNWFEEALRTESVEPNAMNLATVSKDGVVSSRQVLLKAFDKNGFVFFTNYNSQKARDLDVTATVALNFWWEKLYRQIRIQGKVEKTSVSVSEEYFNSRPKGSQIGAHASQQSEVIENYAVLEKEYQRLEQLYKDQVIPCPKHWGGYCVVPTFFEFWQGRPNRLHDRLRYSKASAEDWKIERLSP